MCTRTGVHATGRSVALLISFLAATATWAGAAQEGRANGSLRAADLVSLPLEHLLDLEISTASGFSQPMSAAPSLVRVIGNEEIRAHGWRTLAEALASLPGLYGSYDRNYSYLGARGFLRPGDYDTRFLLLVDGYRFNDPIYGQAAVGGDFPLDLDLVERIEYVPGPGSAVYGSSAFFGVINVISKRPESIERGKLALLAGGAGLRGASGQFAHRADDGSAFLAAVSTLRSRGRDLYYAEFDDDVGDGVARGLDGERSRSVLLRANWRDLDVSLIHGRRHKDTPTASFGQAFGVAGSYVVDERTVLRLGHARELSPLVQSSGRFIYGRYDYYGDYLYDDEPGIVVNHDGAEARWFALQWKLVSTAIDRHTLAAGIDVQRNQRLRQYNLDLDPRTVHLDDRRRGTVIGFFVEDEYQLRPNLLLNAGLRYDHDSATGSDFSPRVALIRPGPRSTYKLIAGRAFRSPNAYELYYEEAGGYNQLANPELEPERIHTLEFVASRNLGANTSLDTLVYRYRLSGLISQVEDETSGLLVFRNQDRAQASGAELAFEHRRPDGLALRASYAYARVVADDDDGRRPTNSPRHLFKISATTPVWFDRVLFAIQARHVGSRQGLDAPVSAYTVVDVNLIWPRLTEGLEFQFGVNNVLNRSYFDPAGGEFRQNAIRQDGRDVRLKLSYRF